MNVRIITLLHAVHSALSVGEEPYLADELDVSDTHLAALVTAAEEIEQAARKLRSIVDMELASRLGEGGALRVGDTIRRYAKSWDERCIDIDGFTQWANQHPTELVKAVNPNYVKKASLPPAVRDTFFEKQPGDPKLTRMPVEKAPQWLQSMKDGELRKGHTNE